MKIHVLGIDNGSTAIKAALYDLDGKEIATASRQTTILIPRPGFTERDMEDLWQQNCACIKQVIADSGIAPDTITAIGICGHGKGLYPWGENGMPTCNGIISTDNRAWQYPEKWNKDGSFNAMYPRICQQLIPCQPVSILAWMKEHERWTYDSIQWIFSVTDYIRFRLTGEAYNEATNLSGAGFMNIRDIVIERDILQAFGISEVYKMIPPLRYSAQLCGKITAETSRLTGLAEGTCVAGGMLDNDAYAIAMAVTEPGQFCTITGTWTINEFIAQTPVTGTRKATNSLYAIPGWYLIEDSSATGAGNLEWLIKNFYENEQFPHGKKIHDLLDEKAAAITPETCDVYYLPFLYGSNRHPLAKAGFLGLTSFHTKNHMLRALYESAAFSAKHHIDKLLAIRPRPEAVRIAGMAANSPVWVQIYADILEIPIETVSGVRELGALGAGMAAAISAGIFRDYQEAAAAMVKISRPVSPNSSMFAVYRKKYDNYRSICEALDNIWHRFEV